MEKFRAVATEAIRCTIAEVKTLWTPKNKSECHLTTKCQLQVLLGIDQIDILPILQVLFRDQSFARTLRWSCASVKLPLFEIRYEKFDEKDQS